MPTASERRGRRSKDSPRRTGVSQTERAIGVLSRKPSLYSTRRLVEAIRQRGRLPLVLDTLRCNLVLSREGPRMLYRGLTIQSLESAVPRIGASITGYGLAVVNHLEMMGVPVINGSEAIARSRDKLRCLQLLSRAGIAIPRTVMARDRGNVGRLIEEVGGLPVIIKLIRGTQGVGVMIASTEAEVKTILDTFWDLGQEIVLQELIRESKGRDVRALVIGEQVAGAMRRKAKRGEFRSNLHRGGEGVPFDLPPAYAQAAVRAAKVVGLRIAGVDMLESREGPKIMEINSSPGFEGLESATRLDIAGRMIDHVIAHAAAREAAERAGELSGLQKGNGGF